MSGMHDGGRALAGRLHLGGRSRCARRTASLRWHGREDLRNPRSARRGSRVLIVSTEKWQAARKALRECLKALSPYARQLVHMRNVEELSAQDVLQVISKDPCEQNIREPPVLAYLRARSSIRPA